MNIRRSGKRILTAAAACAVLAASVSAAVLRLTPSQVARELDEPGLAEAFESVDAQAQEARVLDYTVVFEGLVSGERLAQGDFFRDGERVDNRTYAVFAVGGKDGEPLSGGHQTLNELGITITPLVKGYKPWEVNLWTLGGACEAFSKNGTAYYLFSMETLEQFAEEDVYFAVYEGFTVPSAETFTVADDGTFALYDGVEGALFTLPVR